MAKSPDAFRTISEVSDWLDTPAHVLRFWESKFTQIKPVKRAGGRRYYRPEDMALLGGIKTLLHEQGMTIKGVQKLLREQGIRHVASLGPQPLDEADDALPTADQAPPAAPAHTQATTPAPAPVTAPAAPRADRPASAVPAFLAPPAQEARTAPAPQPPLAAPAPVPAPAAPRAASMSRRRAVPDLPPEASAAPGFLSALAAADPAALARKGARLAPGLARLTALRNRIRATL